jgi:1-phosphatidylinositol-3-phosphate 5-kinase
MLQYTVFAAYHLILETTFFEDQRVFLNDKIAPEVESSVVPHLPSFTDGQAPYNSRTSENAKMLPLLPGFCRLNDSSNVDLYDASVGSASELSTKERSTDTDNEVSVHKAYEKEGSSGSSQHGVHDSGRPVNKGKMDGNDSGTIVVRMTSQCIRKQSICEMSQYKRIKYYDNGDTSLGRYLHNLLHSQVFFF